MHLQYNNIHYLKKTTTVCFICEGSSGLLFVFRRHKPIYIHVGLGLSNARSALYYIDSTIFMSAQYHNKDRAIFIRTHKAMYWLKCYQ